MFGYVRPLEGELEVRDFEAYKAVYCGLCHALEKRCGFLARFVLNYDFVFLAMLLDEGVEGRAAEKRRCAAHPLKGRKCQSFQGFAMDLAAEETVILTYYKLADDVADEGLGKRWAGRALKLLLRPAYRRAARSQPHFDAQVALGLQQLSALERANSTQLDRVSDAFARILAASAGENSEKAPLKRQRVLEQLLYHLGRWIYLIDAVEDRTEDAARGRYNPILARFGAEAEEETLRVTLKNSRSMMQSAFQLLEPNRWTPILENILYLGLPAVENAVFARERETEPAEGKKLL